MVLISQNPTWMTPRQKLEMNTPRIRFLAPGSRAIIKLPKRIGAITYPVTAKGYPMALRVPMIPNAPNMAMTPIHFERNMAKAKNSIPPIPINRKNQAELNHTSSGSSSENQEATANNA